MDYGKINSANKLQKQSNPVSVTIANPTEEQKAAMASLRGELEVVYTAQPEYDPETQTIEDFYKIENDKILQYWVITEKPEPEPTLEDRVDNLEGGMDNLLGGETE